MRSAWSGRFAQKPDGRCGGAGSASVDTRSLGDDGCGVSDRARFRRETRVSRVAACQRVRGLEWTPSQSTRKACHSVRCGMGGQDSRPATVPAARLSRAGGHLVQECGIAILRAWKAQASRDLPELRHREPRRRKVLLRVRDAARGGLPDVRHDQHSNGQVLFRVCDTTRGRCLAARSASRQR